MDLCHGGPNQQYYHLVASELNCKHMILGIHREATCLVSVTESG